MTSDQSTADQPLEARPITLRPEDLRDPYLPLAMRGYDREEVDRFIARVADAYALMAEQSEALRQRLRSLETELRAALGEAEASARAVADLTRSSTARPQPPETREVVDALEARLERAESEREKALVDLRQISEHASSLGTRLAALEAERRHLTQQAEAVAPPVADEDAARLLVAAARAADDLRDVSRARALRTLKKARELSALVHAQTERERADLVEVQERRSQAEREAGEILAGARAEADRAAAEIEERRSQAEREAGEILAGARAEADRAAAEIEERRGQAEREAGEILAGARAEADRTAVTIGEERDRVRGLLAGALASLGGEAAVPPSNLMTDLESRLNEDTEPAVS